MKISLNWCARYTNVAHLDMDTFVSQLTQAVAEVEGYEQVNGHLADVIAVKITEVQSHPHAQKLQLVTIDTGIQAIQLVCGASNARVGAVVPYAGLGVHLPEVGVLQEKDIRGVLSRGMLLSEKELGLSDQHEGLLILPADTPVGMPLSQVLDVQPDTVITIDNKSLTHRPDLWGIYGFSRELAVLLHQPWHELYDHNWQNHMHDFLTQSAPVIQVQQKSDACLGYAVVGLTGLNNHKPSPWWLKQALHAAGLRSVNILVDLSQYAMLELGIPNHFYDAKQIAGHTLHIKTLEQAQHFVTLDDQERVLQPGDVMIYDAQKPLVLAGIMGGQSSMVQPDTTDIVIEVAVWQAQKIRQTSSRLGLRTDASSRYEKSLDRHSIAMTLMRCVDLIQQVFPEVKIFSGMQVLSVPQYQPQTLVLHSAKLQQALGLEIAALEVQSILQGLGFGVHAHTDGWQIVVPSWRASKDVMIEADLIEEIGRMHGYDAIAGQAPLWPLIPKKMPPHVAFERRVQDFFVLRGRSLEIFTHPLIGKKLLDRCAWTIDDRQFVLANALSPDRDRLRPSMMPSMLEMIDHNQKHYQAFSAFELGHVANDAKGERQHVAYACWHQQDTPFMATVELIEDFLRYMACRYNITKSAEATLLLPPQWQGWHPYESVLISIDDQPCGYITSIHPSMMQAWKWKGHAVVAEIDMSAWYSQTYEPKVHYQPLPKYQFSTLDFTLLVNKTVAVADVVNVVQQIQHMYISDIKIADVYPLPPDEQAVTVRVWLRDTEKTLTHDILQQTQKELTAIWQQAGYPLRD